MRRADLPTPAAVVDYDIMRRNIELMAEVAREAGVKLRPHTKTHKTPFIAHLQLAAGASGICVAKVTEAEIMAQAGITDILVAYPLVSPEKVQRLLRLAYWVPRVACTMDDPEAARMISREAAEAGRTLEVMVEVDVGLGRSGLSPGAPVVEFVKAASQLPGLKVRGILTYNGRGHASPTPEEREAVARSENEAMIRTARLLAEAGFTGLEVSVGSTPTARYAAALPGITEIRPGTYIFHDNSLLGLGVCRLDQCALRIRTTVVSHPAPDRFTLDAGSKALTSDLPARPGAAGYGFIEDHPGAVIEKLNEEHAFVRYPNAPAGLTVGDRLEVIPNHACGTVNLYDRLYVVKDDEVIAEWAVQGRGRLE